MYLAILGGRVEVRWKPLFRTLYVSMPPRRPTALL
jgi:hypothetical protein